ncbi:MAG: site-specific integrase, partial [Candidatus Faecousia sp.]|nr:site-specific integrase [Candidatus Faecousia sp.]
GNAWRFLSSVIAETTGEKITVRLPQVKPNERPFLTPDQIPTFVEAVHGMPVEIPALLALSSLRRSELLDLKWEQIDLKNGVITVSGSAVYGEGGVLVRKKENKNRNSTRLVPIIPPLRSALEAAQRKSDYVVTMSPAGMYQQINRICEQNGLPKVGIHGLRHSFASLAYHLNVPEKVAMEIGGWSNDQTMRKIYTHISQQDVAAHAKTFTAFFGNQCKNANKTANENEKVTDNQ